MGAKWTTEKDLARLIQARAASGRTVSMTPQTAELVARRLMAAADTDPHLRSLAFRLEVWDRSGANFVELLAASSTFGLVRNAFEMACQARPAERLLVRQGIRVVLDSGEPDPGGVSNVVRLR